MCNTWPEPTSTLGMQAVKALVRLHVNADFSEPLLLAYEISLYIHVLAFSDMQSFPA